MIRTVCQNCRASFQVPEELLGKSLRCAKCSNVMRIAPAGGEDSIFEDENWLDGQTAETEAAPEPPDSSNR